MAGTFQGLDLGRRLAALRLERGLSQSTISRLAGLAPSYISRIETGKVQPTLPTLLRITAALKAPLDEVADLSILGRLQEGSCPVNPGGRCILDSVRTRRSDAGEQAPRAYNVNQLRLLRRVADLLLEDDPDRERVLELLIESLARRPGNGPDVAQNPPGGGELQTPS